MKTMLAFLAFCLILISCNKPKTFDYSLLEGEWIYLDTSHKAETDPMAPRVWGIMPLSLRNHKGDLYDSIYKVIKDTLFFKIFPHHREKLENSWFSKYVIKDLTKDTLTVFALKDSTLHTFYNSNLIKDTSLHVTRICFTSSGCYGTCPVINLEINKDASVHFSGHTFTNKKGYYTGKISNKTFKYFEDIIQKTEIEKLDSIYEESMTDSQAIGINVFYNKGKSKSIYIYPSFYYDLPFINLLSENFMRFDSYFPLTQNMNDYSFPYNKFPTHFQIPLPLLETIKFTPPLVE